MIQDDHLDLDSLAVLILPQLFGVAEPSFFDIL